ncbi:hypothetical protein ACJ41O_003622 [Fusarium nematophilum]
MTACGRPLLDLQGSTEHFVLCGGCKKRATQHLVREQPQPPLAHVQGWPEVEAALYLKNADGTSHSREFDMLIPNKVKSFLKSRMERLITLGGFSVIWQPWSRAYLLDTWDGEDLDEAACMRLLQEHGEPANAPAYANTSQARGIDPDDSISCVGIHRDAHKAHDLQALLDDGAGELMAVTAVVLHMQRRLLGTYVDDADRQRDECFLEKALGTCGEMVKELLLIETELDDALRGDLPKSCRNPHYGDVWKLFIDCTEMGMPPGVAANLV